MRAQAAPWGRKSLAVPLSGIVLLLALALTGADWALMAALLGGTFATLAVLFAPTWTLLAALATGPMLGGWLDVEAGGPLPALTIDRALLFGVAVGFAVRSLRRGGVIRGPGRVEIAMLCFLAVGTVSTLVRGGGPGGASGLRLDVIFLVQSYAVPFLLFFLAKNVVRGERQIRWLLATYCVIGVVVGAMALLQYFAGITWFTPARYAAIHEGRAVGPLSSAPHFGIVMGASLIATVVTLIRARSTPARVTLGLAIALMLLAVFFSKTRAIYLGLLVGVAVLVFYAPRWRRFLGVIALVSLAAGVSGWSLLSETRFVQERIFDRVPIYNRIALWGTAANMIAHRPIAGFGFSEESYHEKRGEYFVQVGDVPMEYAFSLGAPHNEYLHVLVMIGLLGFVPYVIILGGCWRNVSRLCARPGGFGPWERELVLVTGAALAMYLTNGLFGELAKCWYGGNMIYFLLGATESVRLRQRGQARGMERRPRSGPVRRTRSGASARG